MKSSILVEVNFDEDHSASLTLMYVVAIINHLSLRTFVELSASVA